MTDYPAEAIYLCSRTCQGSVVVGHPAGCMLLAEARAPVKQEPGGPSSEPKIGTPGAGKARPADELAAPSEKRDLLPKTPVSQIRGAFKQEQMTPGPTPSPFT